MVEENNGEIWQSRGALVKVAIMGTGGVGGAFGARLAAAGSDVTFIARGRQLEAIRNNGLSIIAPALGDLTVKPAQVTDNPAGVGKVDIVLFCVKLWDTEHAVKSLQPTIGADTAVISLQNGITRDDIIKDILGAEHVVGGVSYVAATIKEPGVIDQRGTVQKIVFGEYSGNRTARVDAFQAACTKAGIEAIVADNIQEALWKKYCYLVAMSSVLAAARLTIGPVRTNPRTRELLVQVMSEAVAVAKARGIEVGADFIDRHMDYFDGLPPDATASMQFDLSIGNRLELPWLGGALVDLGRETGVPTPVTQTLVNVLSPYVNGSPMRERAVQA